MIKVKSMNLNTYPFEIIARDHRKKKSESCFVFAPDLKSASFIFDHLKRKWHLVVWKNIFTGKEIKTFYSKKYSR